jgi:hypothetical protein
MLCAAVCFGYSASAADIKVGSGLICDTKEQAQRYVALLKDDPDDALTAVNAEAKKEDACAVTAIAYVAGDMGETARSDQGDAYRVLHILVLGVVTPIGVQKVTPFPQFTIVKVEEMAI